jgi:hypothetical protein
MAARDRIKMPEFAGTLHRSAAIRPAFHPGRTEIIRPGFSDRHNLAALAVAGE